MSKKTAIIIVSVTFLLVFIALIFFYFYYNTRTSGVLTPTDVTPDTYNPFGTAPDTVTGTPSQGTETPTNGEVATGRLRQITNEPVAGQSLSTQRGLPVVRYMERATGHLYESALVSLEKRRLSNQTIPKVQEAIFDSTGNRVIIRYLDEAGQNIKTFLATINIATSTTNATDTGIDGVPLADNILQVAITPAGDKVFYLLKDAAGSTGYTTSWNGLNKTSIFTSPLTEWIIAWPETNRLVVTTKASGESVGYSYTFTPTNDTLEPLVGNINALTTLYGRGGNLIYGDARRSDPKLYSYSTVSKNLLTLSANTLPEKCVWSRVSADKIYCAVPKTIPLGTYPDAWYQGLVSFTDRLWSFNTTSGEGTLLTDLETDFKLSADVVELKVDNTDQYLIFTNKKDLTVWLYDLTE